LDPLSLKSYACFMIGMIRVYLEIEML